MSEGLARYVGNEMSEELVRYVGNEVAAEVLGISASLNRGDRESAESKGEELLGSMGRELSTEMPDPEKHPLYKKISEFVENIHSGKDTTHSLFRVYGEIGNIVPWLKEVSLWLKKDDTMLGNYPVD